MSFFPLGSLGHKWKGLMTEYKAHPRSMEQDLEPSGCKPEVT